MDHLALQVDSRGVGVDQEDAGDTPGHHGESPPCDCRLSQHLARTNILEVVPRLLGKCDFVKQTIFFSCP